MVDCAVVKQQELSTDFFLTVPLLPNRFGFGFKRRVKVAFLVCVGLYDDIEFCFVAAAPRVFLEVDLGAWPEKLNSCASVATKLLPGAGIINWARLFNNM